MDSNKDLNDVILIEYQSINKDGCLKCEVMAIPFKNAKVSRLS